MKHFVKIVESLESFLCFIEWLFVRIYFIRVSYLITVIQLYVIMDLANQVIPKKLATCVFISNNQAESDIQSYLSHLSLQERKAILSVLQRDKELQNQIFSTPEFHCMDLQITQEHSVPQHCDKGKESNRM